ncbi:YGGT family protein [Nitzschia inconspicua]|uniref:YGGT family protein n=1 Tax=Nitzschia inconspicua TaxID=303405 RepID=A0A9K3LRQ9_9STRA|nr:YGGT family protein [Nitzschia inconspicua]
MPSKSGQRSLFLLLATLATTFSTASASVFLPDGRSSSASVRMPSCRVANRFHRENAKLQKTEQLAVRSLRLSSNPTTGAATAIPGYGIAEQVFVGGFQNFLSIFNLVITARILLSWFPQAQGVALLQPVYAITDPYLNLFRGLIPPIFGLDLSPILAFFLLNVLTNATAALGAEMTPELKKKLKHKSYSPFVVKQMERNNNGFKIQGPSMVTLGDI